MASAGAPESSREKPLRLWPGVAGAIIVVFARFVIAPFVPGGGLIGLLVGGAGAALILLRWLFFSRAPWLERIGAVLLIALAAVVKGLFVHPSIGGGAMHHAPPYVNNVNIHRIVRCQTLKCLL